MESEKTPDKDPLEAFVVAYRALCKEHGFEIRGAATISPEGRIIVQLVPVAIGQ